jgi:hypothetical protein
MGAHLIDGQFQSAQPLLWQYAEGHRAIDPEFSDDLQEALRLAGYVPAEGRLNPADLPPAQAIIDYGNGHLSPVMFHWAAEGQNLEHIAREAGFECRWLGMDDDLDDMDRVFVDYFEHGASADEILPRWQPTEQGDGWVLSGKWDTEDGPTAVFLRPLAKRTPEDGAGGGA